MAEAKEEASSTGRVIQVLVEVSESVKVDSSSQVFIFAKAISGPPMPLAVQRLNVAGLPTLVKLDESMAMMEGMGLANFDQVQVVARISSSGIANASPEDYEIKSGRIDLTAPVPVIKLKIEKKIRDQ
jgi:cytochrome c-type biogenesis protein CcmH